MGFTDRPGTSADWNAILDYFQHDAAAPYQAYIVGGVPYWWRTGNNDSQPGFEGIYERLDSMVPWSVGRYATNGEFDGMFSSVAAPDKTLTDSRGQGYAPVIWPGFSWANLQGVPGSFNQIPRNGGRLLWHQVVKHHTLDPQWVFMAMFDEVDESTALFKAAPSAANTPVQGQFLTLDQDGESLPSDWYLQISGAATKAFEHQVTPVGELPFSP